MAKLHLQDFIQVVRNAPLVAIDLIIENEDGEILLGYRKNNPAKNTWFVPGGRIFKNENFKTALVRIVKDEIGVENLTCDYKICNVSDHMYDTCFLDDDPYHTKTHYIVISVRIHISRASVLLDNGLVQHTDMMWMRVSDILARNDVHRYTKNYFTRGTLEGTISL